MARTAVGGVILAHHELAVGVRLGLANLDDVILQCRTQGKGDKSGLNTREIVGAYRRAGVPYEKRIIGAAFYGRHFEITSFEDHGLLQPSGGGLPDPSYGEITPEYLRENNFQVYWDADAEANYLWNGRTLVNYESPKAVRLILVFNKTVKNRFIRLLFQQPAA